jgi:hypothetical protein
MWKLWIYLCENVHFLSTKEIITRKLGKKIYGHEQCVVCVTLKIQATPHFSHNLLGLVHSCSTLQCPLSCFPSLLECMCNWWCASMSIFLIIALWETSSPFPNCHLLLLIITFFILFFLLVMGPPPCHLLSMVTTSSWLSFPIGGRHLLLMKREKQIPRCWLQCSSFFANEIKNDDVQLSSATPFTVKILSIC